MDISEIQQEFLDEALEMSASISSALSHLLSHPTSTKHWVELAQRFHNIKGAAQIAGFEPISTLTHSIEAILIQINKSGQTNAVSQDTIRHLIQCNDLLIGIFTQLQPNPQAEYKESIAKANDRVKSIQLEQSRPKEEIPSREEFVQKDRSAKILDDAAPAKDISIDIDIDDESNTETEINHQSSHKSESLDTETNSSIDSTPKTEAATTKPIATKANASIQRDRQKRHNRIQLKSAENRNENSTLRVHSKTVESLINLVGELVIQQSIFLSKKEAFAQDETLVSSLQQLEKISRSIHEISMELQMVPIRTTFQKLARNVRDISRTLGKSIDCIVEGEDTRLDKTVLDQISDPLIHLVRNSIDHGIELPTIRKKKGKSETGNISLKAYHEGKTLVVEISDDGQGINTSVLHQKAIESGIISASDNLPEHKIVDLIFRSGFSSKDKVTEISGRGVGMDVVKSQIEALGGKVQVHSKLNEGSTFKVSLPLTLTIIDGVIFNTAKQTFIVPQSQVQTIYEMDSIELCERNGERSMLIDNNLLPIYSLSSFLNTTHDEQENEENILLIRDFQGSYGVSVGQVLGQRQVVVKKLGDDLANQQGFMGSSILGNGMPTIIIDLVELLGSQREHNV